MTEVEAHEFIDRWNCFFSLQPRFLIIDFILLLILGLADVFVLWSHSRLKEVRRVLGYSQIVNRKS
jgi:hypothetical protein